MTKKIFYEKVGRKYVPVYEYDSDFLDGLPKGNHLIMCYPGGSSRRYNVDPDYAALIAASRVAEDAICRSISKAAELRPPRTPITQAQQKAWKNLQQAFGDELCTLQGLSIRDCAEAGVKAMIEESEKLLANPSVRKAYERFLMIAELSKENNVVSK